MPVPQITITSAGFAAIVDAEHSGTAPVKLTHVGLTAQHFDVATVGATVPGEAKRLTTFGGQAVAADTLHLNVRDDTADAYTLRGFGLYLQDGTLFAVYSQPAPIMEKASAAVMLLATDIRFAKVNATSIEVGDIDFVNPPATNSRVGVVRLATDLEAEAASDPTLALTPFGLARYINKRFGDGAPSAFVKGLLGLATAALLRTELGLRGAALRDEGHSNGLDADLLDGNHGEYYRDWRNLTGVPSQFPPSPHGHAWASITGQPDTSLRWPTWGEVSSKPATYPPSGHSHPWSDITGAPEPATRWPTWNEVTNKPATYAPAAHSHGEYVQKTGDTMTGPLNINGNALRIYGWGGNAQSGVLYLGTGESYIFKNGANFDIRNETGGYTATIVRGGNILTSSGDQSINVGTLRIMPTAGGDQLFFRANGALGVGIDAVNNSNGSYAALSLRGTSIALNGPTVVNHNLSVTGDFSNGGSCVLSNGGIRTTEGSLTNCGYVSFHTTNGTRRGYIGWNDGSSRLQYSAEGGFVGHSFVGNVVASGGFDFGSSRKLKNIEGPIPYGLAEVRRVATLIGRYRPEFNSDDRRRLFFDAEQLMELMPEVVDAEGVAFNGELVPSIKIDQALPPVYRAVAELAEMVDSLTAELAEMKAGR